MFVEPDVFTTNTKSLSVFPSSVVGIELKLTEAADEVRVCEAIGMYEVMLASDSVEGEA